MIPIQGRQLRVSSEPTYVPSDQNQVVIVSCASTNRAKFEAWGNLVAARLGLKAEFYRCVRSCQKHKNNLQSEVNYIQRIDLRQSRPKVPNPRARDLVKGGV